MLIALQYYLFIALTGLISIKIGIMWSLILFGACEIEKMLEG